MRDPLGWTIKFPFFSKTNLLYRFCILPSLNLTTLLNPDENSEAFHEYLDQLNDVISEGMFIDKDIWVMGFHPNDEPSDFVEEVVFERDIDTAYSMIFVQRLSKLQKSADKLDKKGYYDSYDEEYQASDIYEKREKLYRRLKHGDET